MIDWIFLTSSLAQLTIESGFIASISAFSDIIRLRWSKILSEWKGKANLETKIPNTSGAIWYTAKLFVSLTRLNIYKHKTWHVSLWGTRVPFNTLIATSAEKVAAKVLSSVSIDFVYLYIKKYTKKI
jgi:hypothetical protein